MHFSQNLHSIDGNQEQVLTEVMNELKRNRFFGARQP